MGQVAGAFGQQNLPLGRTRDQRHQHPGRFGGRFFLIPRRLIGGQRLCLITAEDLAQQIPGKAIGLLQVHH